MWRDRSQTIDRTVCPPAASTIRRLASGCPLASCEADARRSADRLAEGRGGIPRSSRVPPDFRCRSQRKRRAAGATTTAEIGGGRRKPPKEISLTDPQAAWVARKSTDPFFAYDANSAHRQQGRDHRRRRGHACQPYRGDRWASRRSGRRTTPISPDQRSIASSIR